jgi:hypothetical protein
VNQDYKILNEDYKSIFRSRLSIKFINEQYVSRFSNILNLDSQSRLSIQIVYQNSSRFPVKIISQNYQAIFWIKILNHYSQSSLSFIRSYVTCSFHMEPLGKNKHILFHLSSPLNHSAKCTFHMLWYWNCSLLTQCGLFYIFCIIFTAIISLNSVTWLLDVIQNQCAHCGRESEFVYTIN